MIALFPSDWDGSDLKAIEPFEQQVVGALWDALGGPVKGVARAKPSLRRFAEDKLGLREASAAPSLQVELDIFPLAIYRVRNPTELYAMMWLGQGQDVDPIYLFPPGTSNFTITALVHNEYPKRFWYDIDCLGSVDWVVTVGKDDTGFYFAARDRTMLIDVLNRCGGKMVCCY
jgi:hypothetical protein